MSCAASIPLAHWFILALLIVVAALWGGVELVMYRRAQARRYCQLWDRYATAMTQLQLAGMAHQPIPNVWVHEQRQAAQSGSRS